MKGIFLHFALLALFALSACDYSNLSKSSPSENNTRQQLMSMDDIVRLAASGGSSFVPLDEICPLVNPQDFIVEKLAVGLITDVGGIDDGTFNQAAFSGMEAAARCFGITTTFLESAGQDANVKIQSLIKQNIDVIITVGFLFQESTSKSAKAEPHLKFIGIDQTNPENLTNYVAVSFRDDQVGFLAGAMAGLLTSSGVVGVIAGPASIPPVAAIAEGFEKGALHVMPTVTVLRRHLGSFNNPQAGSLQAAAFLDKGADVLFGAAGDSGTGATLTAATRGAYVIGVDMDEYYTTFRGGAVVGADRIATSAIKRVDLGVFLTLAAMSLADVEGGEFVLDAGNGGVTYAPFHQVDVPENVASRLEALRISLAKNEIKPDGSELLSIQHSKYD